ncbi:DUF6221 family protein [Rhizocola hellebori]|uniref:DUF6221 family protein n=1 Tax=Rhizocola hellebori TaxID=1392758 RepID=UPI0019446C45|nr:DUF6221 family protein [Rhizocola hellebori]
MADTLIDKLKAALDEDERIALRAAGFSPTWSYDRETFTIDSAEGSVAARKAGGSPINDVDGEHIARHDPARALRQVAAHRKLLELHPIYSKPKLGFIAAPDRKDPAVMYEQVGVEYMCGKCDQWRHEEFYHPEPWCDTLLALAEVYGIEVPADVR